jgi:sec-independent protein translocase protein TatA
MPGWIGPWELAILLVVVLLVFGPKRLPEMGKSLGKGMREFKDSITGDHHHDEKAELPESTMAKAEAPSSVDNLSPEERQRLRSLLDAADEPASVSTGSDKPDTTT